MKLICFKVPYNIFQNEKIWSAFFLIYFFDIFVDCKIFVILSSNVFYIYFVVPMWLRLMILNEPSFFYAAELFSRLVEVRRAYKKARSTLTSFFLRVTRARLPQTSFFMQRLKLIISMRALFYLSSNKYLK